MCSAKGGRVVHQTIAQEICPIQLPAMIDCHLIKLRFTHHHHPLQARIKQLK